MIPLAGVQLSALLQVNPLPAKHKEHASLPYRMDLLWFSDTFPPLQLTCTMNRTSVVCTSRMRA